MKHFILGTAGHIDHGKTALVKALTGVDTDRLPEEKERGISIDLGFAPLKIGEDLFFGVVDVPGHEKFVKSMIGGAGGTDVVVLCVAADEGIKPQTVEHLNICRLLNIGSGIAVITRADLADGNAASELKHVLVQFLKDTVFAGSEPIVTSVKTGQGMARLKEELAKTVKGMRPKRSDGNFRLDIDRVFHVKGFGTVVTGTSLRGRVKTGDELCIYSTDGKETPVAVRGIESFNDRVESAEGGERLGINLAGVERCDVVRGDILGVCGRIKKVKMFDAYVQNLKGSPVSMRQGEILKIAYGTRESECRIGFLGKGAKRELNPSQEGFARITLSDCGFMEFGQRFILRKPSPNTTIGGGIVLDPAARRTIGDAAKYVAELESLRSGELNRVIEALLERSRFRGLTRREIADYLDHSYPAEPVWEALDSMSRDGLVSCVKDGSRFISANSMASLVEEISRSVFEYHAQREIEPGMPMEELKQAFARVSNGEILAHAIDLMVSQGKLEKNSGRVNIPGRGKYLNAREREITESILKILAQGGNCPLDFKELSNEVSVYGPKLKDYMKHLESEGKIIKVSETLYYHAQAIKNLERSLLGIIKDKGSISVADFKDMTRTSRKYAIPLLEYFDRSRITLRRKDDRRILGIKADL